MRAHPARIRAGFVRHYSLPIMDLVKISSKHQITIGREAFEAAGFEEGEILTMRALGPGCVEIRSMRTVVRDLAGTLTGAAGAHARIGKAQDEWD